jgi:hypothetical protein
MKMEKTNQQRPETKQETKEETKEEERARLNKQHKIASYYKPLTEPVKRAKDDKPTPPWDGNPVF